MPGPEGFDSYLRLRLGASLALLQPGIDPVFLVLLSDHSGVALADHGLVVGASQAGMAAGALVVAFMPRPPRAGLQAVAAIGAILSAATVFVDGLAAILLVRLLFGLTTGVLYAATLRAATARSPAHAMGTIFFFQLMFSTLVALVLPEIAIVTGSAVALLCLAIVPLALLLLLASQDAVPAAETPPAATAFASGQAGAQGFPAPAAVAIFLFVTASAMIWSYAGAEGVVAGLSDQIVGLGVAMGSLAACAAALVVARGMPVLPAGVCAAFSALLMAAPLAAPTGATGFLLAMIAFNIGATYSVARFSALAIERLGSARGLVPVLHSAAMVLGPLVAAIAVSKGGFPALAGCSIVVLLAAVAALAVGAKRRVAATAPAPAMRFDINVAAHAEGP